MYSTVSKTPKPTAKPRQEPGNDKTPADTLCELCEDAPAINLCNECEQSICTQCTRLHSRQNATKSHTFTSLDSKPGGEATVALQDLLQTLETRVASAERDAQAHGDDAAKITAAKASATDNLKKMQLKCHGIVDNQFERLEVRIANVFDPQLAIPQGEQTKLKLYVDELRKHQEQAQQLLINSDSALEGTERLLEAANETLSKVKLDSEVKVNVPCVSVTLNEKWVEMEPCHVTSAAADATVVKQAQGENTADRTCVVNADVTDDADNSTQVSVSVTFLQSTKT